MKDVDYRTLCAEAESLIAGVRHPIANLSNLSALIFQTLGGLNWAGFYLREGETLVLGPFQGRVACIEIPLGRGVCGTAAREDKTQLVPDVHAFPGHIACDGASNSEIVIPLHRGGERHRQPALKPVFRTRQSRARGACRRDRKARVLGLIRKTGN